METEEFEYTPIIWKSGFQYPNMVRIEVPQDGNCFFHAILKAFYVPYRIGISNKMPVDRLTLVKALREDLAKKLEMHIDSKDINSSTYYNTLSRGNLSSFAASMPEYSLVNMQKTLRNGNGVDNIYNEFISDQINKDIYLLDFEKQEPYITGDDDEILHKNRDSVVIMHLNNHYELVGILHPNNTIQTYFGKSHPFIEAIKDRHRQLRSKNMGSK